MKSTIRIADFACEWASSPFGRVEVDPWLATSASTKLVAAAIRGLSADFRIEGDVAIHRFAEVEPGAVIKGPAIVGASSLVASGSYLRGGVYVDESCIVGPGCELKATFMLRASKVAHLSFVGDSILGTDVNVEAGAIVANHRNELTDKRIRFVWRGTIVDTGSDRFGALIGDGSRIGANAVIAPGAVLEPRSRVARLGHIDQIPGKRSTA